MKQTGMLVVSLRGVNFGFWSRLGCSGQSANISCQRSRLGFREETQNYAKRNRSQISFLICFVYRIASVIISLNQRFKTMHKDDEELEIYDNAFKNYF